MRPARSERTLLALPLLLVACATTPAAAPIASRVAAVAAPPGLERLIGRPAEAALALLGAPSLDRREGAARQLQFARAGCVLDLFFYPRGGAALATFAAARRSDGGAMEAAACLAALVGR